MTAPVTAPAPLDLAAVYREHHAFVWRSLRRLGVADRELPDATHDLFLVVHRRLAEFDRRHPITTWLYAICLRVASDRRRRASARYEELGEHEPAPSAHDPDARGAERIDRRRLLEQALDAMPLEQRAVFVLFELEAWDGERIATALDIPVGTVHSRLRLARGTFKQALARGEVRARFDLHRSELGR